MRLETLEYSQMAVKMRLMRFGKRNRPCYRVCVFDARTRRDGAYIESIGSYDPYIEDDRKKIQIDRERAEYWLGVGAQPSETVASFLRQLSVSGLVNTKKPRRKRPMTKKVQRRRAAKKAAAKQGGAKTTKKPKKPSKKKE